ncbi:Uncharacterized protein K02A2.6 [Eumeta japonica]|uniref:Uncharacterized protein K02A2.6 n=1 Tax=Eumeta variegata TaxID=151549 RepID=A0A4C1Z0R8_EUMVA|nr:Uncharacterized protein K02A2.6 [Eumeta japonica]
MHACRKYKVRGYLAKMCSNCRRCRQRVSGLDNIGGHSPSLFRRRVVVAVYKTISALDALARINYSDFASLIVPLLRNDASIRLCADYSVSFNEAGLEGVRCFLNDVLITGRNKKEYLERLNEVLRRFQNAGWTLHKEKWDQNKPHEHRTEYWRTTTRRPGRADGGRVADGPGAPSRTPRARSLPPRRNTYAQIRKKATAIIFGVRRVHQFLYARSDKPLISIFGSNKGVPEVSADQLQRYAIFLSAYNYKIEYVRKTENNADYLSRAATSGGAAADDVGLDRAADVNFILSGGPPVTLDELKKEDDSDSVLKGVVTYILKGWPKKIKNPILKPYHQFRTRLSVENGIVTRGHKVVIPSNLRNTILDDNHSSNFWDRQNERIKVAARARLWFPGVDVALERWRPSAPCAPLAPWPHPPRPFYKIHLDFLGSINNKSYTIAVDAFSKWVECFDLNSNTTSASVIGKLNLWYLDDGTIGGDPEFVDREILTLILRLATIRLDVMLCDVNYDAEEGAVSAMGNGALKLMGFGEDESRYIDEENIHEYVKSDRVDCIGSTHGSELNNKYEKKNFSSLTQGTVALHIGLTGEGRGRTVIYSDDLGVGLGVMLGNCEGQRVLNIWHEKIRSWRLSWSWTVPILIYSIIEHWLRNGQLLFNFPNHQVTSSFDRENSSRGGSFIVIRNNPKFKERTNIVGLFAERVVEIACLELLIVMSV